MCLHVSRHMQQRHLRQQLCRQGVFINNVQADGVQPSGWHLHSSCGAAHLYNSVRCWQWCRHRDVQQWQLRQQVCWRELCSTDQRVRHLHLHANHRKVCSYYASCTWYAMRVCHRCCQQWALRRRHLRCSRMLQQVPGRHRLRHIHV